MKKYLQYLLIGLSVTLCAPNVYGQLGGQHIYEFLSLPSSGRVTALGGSVISIMDDDISLAYHNPASLNSEMHNRLSFNHNFHLADISNGYFAFGRHLPKWGITTHAAINYIDYGEFVAADDRDVVSGTFDAGETAIVVGASKRMNERIVLGANFKTVFSRFENYNSTGLVADLGLNYVGVDSSFVFSIVANNIGGEVSSYTENYRGSAPFNLQIGFTKKLTHLPFRVGVIADNLQTWDIRYNDPNRVVETNLFGEIEEQSGLSKGSDNFFRHFVFSGEFLLGKRGNLRLRMAYRHLRRQELAVEGFRSLAGFSGGFGIKVSKFRFDYGVGYHHLGGATNHITISTGLMEFTSKL